MSEVQKQYQEQKQNPAGKVGSSAKSKSASLPTPLDCGGAGNAVKGQDERQQRAPLTAFPAPWPRVLFLHLTQAVVVIHGMVCREGEWYVNPRLWQLQNHKPRRTPHRTTTFLTRDYVDSYVRTRNPLCPTDYDCAVTFRKPCRILPNSPCFAIRNALLATWTSFARTFPAICLRPWWRCSATVLILTRP